MRFGRILAAGTAVVLLLAAGCSGDDAETAADPTTTTTVEPTTTTLDPTCVGGADVQTGEQLLTLRSSGVERSYLQYVPTTYEGTALPVVVNLHGFSSTAEQQRQFTGMDKLAETEGFITVTPQGLGPTGATGWIPTEDSRDVRFIEKLLDRVEADVCVNTDRVYVTGMSNGAMMTSRLACDLPDRFAAAAPVSGLLDPNPCDPAQPIAILTFHGTADEFLPYDGGLGDAVGGFEGIEEVPDIDTPSVPDTVAIWAERNGCGPEPEEEPFGDVVTVTRYEDCEHDATVELHTIDGGGHTWPDDATELIWDFFEQHPLGGTTGS